MTADTQPARIAGTFAFFQPKGRRKKYKRASNFPTPPKRLDSSKHKRALIASA